MVIIRRKRGSMSIFFLRIKSARYINIIGLNLNMILVYPIIVFFVLIFISFSVWIRRCKF